MANDIEKKKPTDLANDQKNVFEAYGDAATARAIEGDLLKFVQGDYFAGQDNREIPLGTKLVARMDTLAIGWLRWQDNAPGDDERMGLVARRLHAGQAARARRSRQRHVGKPTRKAVRAILGNSPIA